MAESIRNTFSRTQGNDAKYGYYPTELSIVEREMNLIRFDDLQDDSIIPICDFTGGTGEQLETMYQMLLQKGLRPKAYYNEITLERFKEAKATYGDLSDFYLCNTNLFSLKCRNKDGRKYDAKTMVVIRNNPPYGDESTHSGTRRLEEKFFLENHKYLVDGGIHILEVPYTTLINYPSFLRKIFYRYKGVEILDFPETKYKQVVVIGVKKRNGYNDNELADEWLEKIKAKQLKNLRDIEGPLFNLEQKTIKKAKEVTVYRDGRVNEETLTNGLFSIFNELQEREKREDPIEKKIQVVGDETAIVERGIGHRALELASGKFNKVCGDVLIYGYADKKIETTVEIEGDKEITTETEKIVSGIEVTNKYGKVIRKES
jgi:hypothetical protein